MNNGWVWVDTFPKMIEARDDIAQSPIICIDTEYDSFRYFRDMLCLIQIQTGEKTWLIDPLAGLDISFLGDVLNDPGVLKIMHAGDNAGPRPVSMLTRHMRHMPTGFIRGW